MGAVCSCCGAEEAAKAQIDNNEAAPPSKKHKKPPPPREAVLELKEQLGEGVTVLILLQDGSKLACNLTYDPEKRDIAITHEEKVRLIPVSEIKGFLETREQLRRVETKANLLQDDACVGLHLSETGNCIPMQFSDAFIKRCFVELMKDARKGAHKY